jgi:hypothetical protein
MPRLSATVRSCGQITSSRGGRVIRSSSACCAPNRRRYYATVRRGRCCYCSLLLGVGEPVGVSFRFDDGAVECQHVNNHRAKPRVGVGLRPAGERLIRGDRDGAVPIRLVRTWNRSSAPRRSRFFGSEVVGETSGPPHHLFTASRLPVNSPPTAPTFRAGQM